MSESQTLIQAQPQQTAIDVGAPAQGGRSTRAYKVAGLTLLACILVMSQAMIVYFLVTQNGDIKSLEKQSTDMKDQMSRGKSVAPLPMHLPSSIGALTFDEDTSTGVPEKKVPREATQCEREAAGLQSLPVPGLRPECDEHGLYRPQQCFMQLCWCVNPANGERIPGSERNGAATCNKAVRSGRQHSLFSLSDVEV